MKLDKELAGQLYVPTTGMEPFNIINHQSVIVTTGLYDEIKSTQFFRDVGQLHCDHSGHTLPAFFIQREDGLLHVVSAGGAPSVELVREYLDPDLKAEVILCEVDADNLSRAGKGFLNAEYGVYEFLAKHHPSCEVRSGVLKGLLEKAQCEHVSQPVH